MRNQIGMMTIIATLLFISLNTVSFAYMPGIRLTWDYRTLTFIGQGTYGRMARLQNGDICCVYQEGVGICFSKSSNEGRTWSPAEVKRNETNLTMAVPCVAQLKNGDILVGYNPRVNTANGIDRFQIRTMRSSDTGRTWKNETTLFSGGTDFNNGCWEPDILPLSNGKIVLTFSNESPYTTNNDQEISMMLSTDNGATWTAPEKVSYRAGGRDGMSVAIELAHGSGIGMSIEDNNVNKQFRPTIITTSIDDLWASGYVGATSPLRWFALADQATKWENYTCGAPYLRQLPKGETVLSFHSTCNRTNDWTKACCQVAIGDTLAKNFTRVSVPFNIPLTFGGLWNSLFIKNDSTVTALTATGCYPQGAGVYSVDGRVLPEILSTQQAATATRVFMGAYSLTNSIIYTTWDNSCFYIDASVTDQYLWSDSDTLTDDDAITVFFDTKNLNRLATGVFSITADAKGRYKFCGVSSTGTWTAITVNDIIVKAAAQGTLNNNNDIDSGYHITMQIPWVRLGGQPQAGQPWGINFSLSDDKNGDPADLTETVPGNTVTDPSSWCSMTLVPGSVSILGMDRGSSAVSKVFYRGANMVIENAPTNGIFELFQTSGSLIAKLPLHNGRNTMALPFAKQVFLYRISNLQQKVCGTIYR